MAAKKESKFKLFLLSLLISAAITFWTICPEFSHFQTSWENIKISVKYKSKQNKTELKYILLWTDKYWYPLLDYIIKHEDFFKYKCKVTNCFVTDNRTYFGGDLKRFDAVLFHGQELSKFSTKTLPLKRYPHQKYVFTNKEPAERQPVCSEIYDNYFNWTLTYKLDSTLDNMYMLIRDTNGTLVGPKTNMTWVKDMKDVNDSFAKSLETKTKAAAWFVSNCHTSSKREDYVKVLQKELNKYKLTVDIYGKCGNLTCSSSDDERNCDEMLRKYFFYLAFENSILDDYVTEKIIIGLNHNTVPIVYGGANYSRFLPPGSYLHAGEHTPEQLAATMNSLIKSPKDYRQYFKWKSYYTYSGFKDYEGICQLCCKLNDDKVFKEHTLVKNFRLWWHCNFVNRCG